MAVAATVEVSPVPTVAFVVPRSRYRCTACRSPMVTFVTPGSAEVRSETGILVSRGVGLHCACLSCRRLGLA